MAELRPENCWKKFWRRRGRWTQLGASLTAAIFFSFSAYSAWENQIVTVGTRRLHWLFTAEHDPALFWLFLCQRVAIAAFGAFTTLLAIAQLREGIDAATPWSHD